MKELEAHKIFLKGDNNELHQEANQKQEFKFIGTLHLRSGMKLWCYNPDEDTMKKVVVTGKAWITLSGKVGLIYN